MSWQFYQAANLSRPRFFAILGWLLVLSLLITSCAVLPSREQIPAGSEREPFTSRSEIGGGLIASWSGFSDGYQPGGEEEIKISLENQTEQTWNGRFCIQLHVGQFPSLVTSLVQQEFTLETGTGFTDTLTVQFPQELDSGAYGLSLVVQHPDHPIVDLVPIQVGETEAVWGPATQEDLDASRDTCPSLDSTNLLVELAIQDLAEQNNLSVSDIEVVAVESVDFSDASLGAPEPGMTYAQVITSGARIELQVEQEVFIYHAGGNRCVLVETKNTAASTQRIDVHEAGISFEIPANWQQPTEELRWIPEAGAESALGFTWLALDPPQEPEAALLPSPSQVLSSTEIDPGWGKGRSITLEVFGVAGAEDDTQAPVEAVQNHIIIIADQEQRKLAFDFFSTAPNMELLLELESALEGMLESVRFSSPASEAEGLITIQSVEINEEILLVRGISSLPESDCLLSELWADGFPQSWWPGNTCIPVSDGLWVLSVDLENEGQEISLDPDVQYLIRVYQQNGPNIVSTFPFDLTPPPGPGS